MLTPLNQQLDRAPGMGGGAPPVPPMGMRPAPPPLPPPGPTTPMLGGPQAVPAPQAPQAPQARMPPMMARPAVGNPATPYVQPNAFTPTRGIGQQMAAQGRGPDSTLVHMAPNEVAGLNALAQSTVGRGLTTNPSTGLPEAGILSSILPMILGAVLSPFITPMGAAAVVGAGTGLMTHSLTKGLMAGLSAFGGAGIGGALGGIAKGLGTTAMSALAPAATDAATAAGTAASTTAAAVAPAAETGLAGLVSNGAGGLAAAAPAVAAPAAAGAVAPLASTGLAGLGGAEGGLAPTLTEIAPAVTPSAETLSSLAPAVSETAPLTTSSSLSSALEPATGLKGMMGRFGDTLQGGAQYKLPGMKAPLPGLGALGIPRFATTAAGATGIMSALSDAMKPSATKYKADETPGSAYAGPYKVVPRTLNIPPASNFNAQGIPNSSAEFNWFTPDTSVPYTYETLSGGAPPGYPGYIPPPQIELDARKKLLGYAKGGTVALRPGGFVMDARTVSELGNGSSSAGKDLLRKHGGEPIEGGSGDGVSDGIPAKIVGKRKNQPARVARDEVKFSPEAVRRMGGAQKLYGLVDAARKSRASTSTGQDNGLRRGLA
jgi:hypothetical protein